MRLLLLVLIKTVLKFILTSLKCYEIIQMLLSRVAINQITFVVAIKIFFLQLERKYLIQTLFKRVCKGIYRSENLDRRDIDQYYAQNSFGTPHKHRNSSLSQNYARNLARDRMLILKCLNKYPNMFRTQACKGRRTRNR
jgi:hypothetical protein